MQKVRDALVCGGARERLCCLARWHLMVPPDPSCLGPTHFSTPNSSSKGHLVADLSPTGSIAIFLPETTYLKDMLWRRRFVSVHSSSSSCEEKQSHCDGQEVEK